MSNVTQLIHSITVDPLTGAIVAPICQPGTFMQQAPGVNKSYDYAQTSNRIAGPEEADNLIIDLKRAIITIKTNTCLQKALTVNYIYHEKKILFDRKYPTKFVE